MSTRPAKGFSVIELLIVMLIMGIMAGVGYASLRGMLENSKLDSAKAQVANSLSWARSYAQTKNFSASWIKINDTTYKLKLRDKIKIYTLPKGIKFDKTLKNGTTITYRAPYGEVNINGSNVKPIKIILKSERGKTAEIHVLGVSGKVIKQ